MQWHFHYDFTTSEMAKGIAPIFLETEPCNLWRTKQRKYETDHPMAPRQSKKFEAGVTVIEMVNLLGEI